MKLSQFKFRLPEELIALYPAEDREESRLMVVDRKTKKIEHLRFKDIINYIKKDDVIVLNNSKVFPSKLIGYKEKTGAKIEVLLLRELNPEQRLWDAMVEPARKIRIGNKLFFGEKEDLIAEVVDNTTNRGRTLRFLYDGDYETFKKKLYSLGQPPLPRFIKREVEEIDYERYQTIYATEEGSVVAPAAGLHFSKILLKKIELIGAHIVYVTLHAGLCNFKQIEVEDLSKHKADSEQIIITEEACRIINDAKIRGSEIFAVGTTVIRTLESSITTEGFLKPANTWTNKFIYPPYQFNIPTRMITNFHLPCSIPMLTAAAFCGYELLMEAYKTAIKEQYRFGSYGDAMLII